MKIVGIVAIPPGCTTSLELFINKPIIYHVIDYVKKLKFINDIVVVTDNTSINNAIKQKYSDV